MWTPKDKPLPDDPRRTAEEAAMSGVLGGWSGATFASTIFTIADFYLMSRGNFSPIVARYRMVIPGLRRAG